MPCFSTVQVSIVGCGAGPGSQAPQPCYFDSERSAPGQHANLKAAGSAPSLVRPIGRRAMVAAWEQAFQHEVPQQGGCPHVPARPGSPAE